MKSKKKRENQHFVSILFVGKKPSATIKPNQVQYCWHDFGLM